MKISRILTVTTFVCTQILLAGALARAEQPANYPSATASLHRASALHGMAVKNDKGESLGHVSDLMIDAKDGRVIYAAIDYRDSIGAAPKHFAVPLPAMRIEPLPDRPKEKYFLLRIDKAEFDDSAGFKIDDWPTAPDSRFLYNLTVGAAGVRVQVSIGAARDENRRSELRRARVLMGMAMQNNRAERLGKVRDLMVDTDGARVVYAAMGHGGTIGLGEKLFAVPWEAINVTSLTGKASDESFVLDVANSELVSNAGFSKDNWPTEGDLTLFGKRKQP